MKETRSGSNGSIDSTNANATTPSKFAAVPISDMMSEMAATLARRRAVVNGIKDVSSRN